ncbi:MAG: hypothetical protein K0S80_3835, partial [Neobacillus sp.]|nr:hypothetical protein [Neobacillus sp.]
MLTGKYLEP